MLATKTDVDRLERRLTTKIYIAGAAVAVLFPVLDFVPLLLGPQIRRRWDRMTVVNVW